MKSRYGIKSGKEYNSEDTAEDKQIHGDAPLQKCFKFKKMTLKPH